MFYGRETELTALDELWEKPVASLVVCRGRRRIGKSTLIGEFARRSKARLIVFEGVAPKPGVTNKTQLERFARQLSEQCGGVNHDMTNWYDAFAWLDVALRRKSRTVVLFDEVSWMGKFDPSFPSDLKFAWDTRFKQHANHVFVVCGSVSSWIADNISNSTAFFGRISRDMVVGELPLDDAVKFWGDRLDRLSPRDVVDVLSVTGGVPKYLEDVNPSFSASENIRRLCFRPDGQLFQDFREIFNEVFGATTSVKRQVLECLADGPLSCAELATKIGVKRGGSLERNLEDLEIAGFVSKDPGVNPESGKRARLARYRLKDNYTRFYLKYIEPHEAEIRSGRFAKIDPEGLPGWDAVMGLQFENLILNNVDRILLKMGLDKVPVLSAAPFRKTGRGGTGCQIDLLILTRKSVCIVEVKRKNEIGEEVEREVARKAACLTLEEGKSIRTALVYEGRLLPVVRANAYFDFVIDIASLMRR
jgi:uncharacterized protein